MVFLEDERYLKKMGRYSKLEEYPFFKEIKLQVQSPKILDSENCKCDEVFAEYILKIAKYVNKDYLIRIIKFVVLFRECLNTIYKPKNKAEKGQFSENYNAEDAPDISNEFVTDFLETDVQLFDFLKDESIDLTQNFCQWLYDNNYTCSKLSLISPNS